MKPGGMSGCDDATRSGLDEVVAEKFGVMQRGVVQPDQAKAMGEIANGVVMGISYEREQIALRTHDRGGWAPVRSALADYDADLQHGIFLKLEETAPEIVDDRQDGLFVGDHFDSEAERIEDGTIRERDLASERIVVGLRGELGRRDDGSGCIGSGFL
jgi:hypothetical protein